MVSPDGLWEILPDAKGLLVSVSNITDTIFGEDATDFDYYLGGDTENPGNIRHFDRAIETVETLARVFRSGDQDALLIAMENNSLGGMLSAEKAADKAWLCWDLDCPMNRVAEACKEFQAPCSVWERIEL